MVGGVLVNMKILKLPFVIPMAPWGEMIVVATIGAMIVTILARVLAR
jgi:uncharacterized membrane protein YeaQ/YmgE (transglycosylase-associated protein family)